MNVDAIHVKGKVDVAILTIREDEAEAVLQRFPMEFVALGRRHYNLCRMPIGDGEYYTIAVVRCHGQGTTTAQAMAHAVIDELSPQWILVVGVAGGLPSNDFSLGDVVVSTYVHDFSVEVALEGGGREFSLKGGDLAPATRNAAANLVALRARLGPWGSGASLGMAACPPVPLDEQERFTGEGPWQERVRTSLVRHFSAGGRAPVVKAGPIASSDRLVKDTQLVQQLLPAIRHVAAVEMESAGVYAAARDQQPEVPFLAIRGISDIVGYRKVDEWVRYACHTAAAFTRAFLCTRPIKPRLLLGMTAQEKPSPQPPGAPYLQSWHVRREKAERMALSYLGTRGKPAILWGPEQFGKTWLMEALLEQVKGQLGGPCRIARINLKLLGEASHATHAGLLQAIAAQLVDELGATDDADKLVGEAFARPGTPNIQMTWLVREILVRGTTPLILAVDRADAIVGRPYRDDFFGMMRAWAERLTPPWPQLRLLLAVSTTPIRLTEDPNRSVFSGLSEPVELDDLNRHQVEELAALHGVLCTEESTSALIRLVGGHPYLVRLVLHQAAILGKPLVDTMGTPGFGGLFDGHLKHCRAALVASPAAHQALRQVGSDKKVEPDEAAYEHLHGLGLAVRDGAGVYRLRCQLYERLV